MLKIIFWLLCTLFEDCSLSLLDENNLSKNIKKSAKFEQCSVRLLHCDLFFLGKVWLMSQLQSMLGRDSKASFLNSEMLDSM